MNERPARAQAIRARLKSDFKYYAKRCLKILAKPEGNQLATIKPFIFNTAQNYIHKRIEEQRSEIGRVRAMILKGRQQGASTYVEGRYYWKTSNNAGEKTYILTHKTEATDNLFAMVERYHDNAPVHVQPHVGKKNSKEFTFDKLDSRYQVATAGAKGAGRSATLSNVHGSEVAFWENATSHLGGMLQAVPLAAGTEVILESTAQGIGNVFHKQWLMAERGESDFIAIFVPWFWQDEYERDVPVDFVLNSNPEDVPVGELTEEEYARAHKLNDRKMFWRRMKIIELGGGEEGFYTFCEEYPATADEAFQASQVGNSLNLRKYVVQARKNDVASQGSLIIGIDPGGEGEGGDPTGIIRRRGRRAFNPQLITKMNTMQLVSLIFRIVNEENPSRVFIDIGNMGKGIFDRLMEMPGMKGVVIAVNFGGAANDPTKYKNRRAEMHWLAKEWLEQEGGANIPDTDAIQGDLLASVIAPSDSEQRRQLRSKEWMKSKGIQSPNLADALALTFALPVEAFAYGQGNSQVDFDPVSGQVDAANMQGNSAIDFDPFV